MPAFCKNHAGIVTRRLLWNQPFIKALIPDSFSWTSISPAFWRHSSERLSSSAFPCSLMLSKSMEEPSLRLRPSFIRWHNRSTFFREIFRSILTVSFIPGVLKIVSNTLATSFAVIIIQNLKINTWLTVKLIRIIPNYPTQNLGRIAGLGMLF